MLLYENKKEDFLFTTFENDVIIDKNGIVQKIEKRNKSDYIKVKTRN